MRAPLTTVILALTWSAPAAAKKLKTRQVTARLVQIPGKLPPDELYDYAYVMKYQVEDGKLKGRTLLVAHYKPRQPRKKIDDGMKKHVHGTLKRFRVGDVHRMTLTPELRRVWKGPLVDEYFASDRKTVRHWCLRVDPAPE